MQILCDTDGEPLGLASLDEPEDGRRPSDEDLRLTGLICSYAEYALRLARRTEAAEDEKRLLSCLNEVSPRLSACGSLLRLHALLIKTLVDHFGFGRVAIMTRMG